MVSEYKRFRDYELMVVFHPELSEEDLVTESDRVQGYLTTAEASVMHVNRDAPWGRRRLAYPIRHGGRDLRDGIYALYYFNAESGRIEDMEREIKLNDRIIRYLLTLQIAPIAEPEVPEGEEGVEAPEGAAPTSEASGSEESAARAGTAPPAEQIDEAPAADAENNDAPESEPEPEIEVTAESIEAVTEGESTDEEK
jgi:small subunit ribosomal protein S6